MWHNLPLHIIKSLYKFPRVFYSIKNDRYLLLIENYKHEKIMFVYIVRITYKIRTVKHRVYKGKCKLYIIIRTIYIAKYELL